jgi:hypothetical protein
MKNGEQVTGDIEVDDSSSLVAEHDQGIEKLKLRRYDKKHVDGGGVMQVIVQEPAPGRGGDLGPPWQVVKHHSVPFLWCLLFGPFYFAAKGAWIHAVIALLAALVTMGLSWLVYPFFAKGIVNR